MIRRFLAAVLAALCAVSASAGEARPVQAFLVQNSGWMEPFYSDPRSPFKALVQALIQAAAEPGDDLVVVAFNQSSGEHRSPQLMYRGNDASQAMRSVALIEPAQKPGGRAFADTDFKEAIVAVLTEHAQTRPTVLWIITNNKNSPGNDQNTAARNREFYELIHNESTIEAVIAFPLAMPVKGQVYTARGLMVYGLAYGPVAGAQLNATLARGGLASLFTDQPARLKPLDRDSMSFVPQGTESSGHVTASLAADRKTLVLNVEATATPQRVRIRGAFRNEFFPFEIISADISARLASGGWAGELGVAPSALPQPIPPGEMADVVVDLPLPASQFPSMWSPAALAAMGTRVIVPAQLEIALTQQQLRVSEAFLNRLAEVFPGDPLPDVFRPPESIAASIARVPVQVHVAYPLYPLVVAALAALTCMLLVVGGLVAVSGEKRYEVMVNGQLRKVAVKPFRSVEIKGADGSTMAVLKRGLGRPKVMSVAQGHQVSVRG